ncbi:DUF397 domain-containing protein [Streptomyces sp. NPDC057298]|uniref:DUF397 domain-containing protein n=1 Tax=Streptomyces sp. NPDC057298 TaxID=3346091 RepID=UPI0036442439
MPTWRKSSASQPADNCVEVSSGSFVMIRDSKNPDVNLLSVNSPAWVLFLTFIKNSSPPVPFADLLAVS